MSEAGWKNPVKWNKQAEINGVRPRVFCASLADVFEDWDGPMISGGQSPVYIGKDYRASHGGNPRLTMEDVRRRLFALIDATPNLDWLLLTKRPENIRGMWPFTPGISGNHPANSLEEAESVPYRPNVWLGTTVENQEQADKRIPELLKCRCLSPCLFLSCEPLLGPVDLDKSWRIHRPDGYRLNSNQYHAKCPTKGIDWLISGGESGPNARPSHPDWFRSLRDQCRAACVPFHFKQWGKWSPEQGLVSKSPAHFDGIGDMYPVGKKKAGRLLDGTEHNEFPVNNREG